MANVLYGQKNTHKVSIENIIQHTMSVRKGTKKSLLVADMPKGSYSNPKKALINASLIMKQTRCDAVKLESYRNNFDIIELLVKKKYLLWDTLDIHPNTKKNLGWKDRPKKKLMHF